MSAFLARRYAEPVEVLTRDGAPVQFLRRGRLHVVRTVLAHWVETGAWWRHATVTGLLAGDPAADRADGTDAAGDGLVLAPLPPSPKWGQRAWGEPAPDVGVSVAAASVDDDERDVWRVEASAGRHCGTGVVELCFSWATGGWTVVGVLD